MPRRDRTNPIEITASMLRLLNMCERRVWLDKFGNREVRDKPSPVMVHQSLAGIEHEQTIHEAVIKPQEPVVGIRARTWDEGVEITRELMKAGVPGIIGAHLENTVTIQPDLPPVRARGKIDRLVILSEEESSSLPIAVENIYAPIEIKRRTQLIEADKFQLDFYLWLLSTIQGVQTKAWFWLGREADGKPKIIIEHELNLSRLETLIRSAIEILVLEQEPPVRIERHCERCQWYTSCRTIAANLGDISVLPRIRKDTREHMKQEGIESIRQIGAMEPHELTTYKGIGKKTAPMIHAIANAFSENRPIKFGTLPDVCFETGFMFDLETKPFMDTPWCLGWALDNHDIQIVVVSNHRENRSHTLPSGRSINLVPTVKQLWLTFFRAVENTNSPIFHWSPFDHRIMQRTAPPNVRKLMEPRTHDLHHSLKRSIAFPTFGMSLKDVAKYLGFNWSNHESWQQAFGDYQKWRSTNNDFFLERAIMYQADDVAALATVWQWITNNDSIA